MQFKIIPDEQTPAVDPMFDPKKFIQYGKPEVLEAFLKFAASHPNAIGLAANQCSLDGERFMHRLFAIKDLKNKTWRLIFDPEITKYIGMKELKEEGCLTWVNKTIVAERSRAVMVSYYNQKGQKIEGEIYKGFEAQIWQHECNHLNGVPERIEPNDFTLPRSRDIGRNESCPCHSGNKYKHCCLLLI